MEITNALWLAQIAPRISDFAKKLAVPGISYESLYAYYQQSIQYGKESTEFWVVFEGREPQAFGHFIALGLPHAGKIRIDALCNWTKESMPTVMIVEKAIEFAQAQNAPLIDAELINDRLFRIFRKYAARFGVVAAKTEHVKATGRIVSTQEE